jgi:hypothetical protein
MPKSVLERLAAFGGIVATAVIALILVWFIAFLSFPDGEGIDWTEGVIAWISVGLLLIAIIATNIVYVRILMKLSRGERSGV